MTLGIATVVSHKMADVWRAERELVRDAWNPDEHAVMVYQGATHGMCALDEDHEPLICGGLMGTGPGTLHTFMFGARGWERVVPEAVRYGRRMIRDALTIDQVHRIQCISLCQHPRGRRFLEAMGLTLEHELRGWGKGGETFFMFARVRED